MIKVMLLTLSFSLLAAEVPKVPSAKIIKNAIRANQIQAAWKKADGPTHYITRSYVEYEPAKYLLFSSATGFNSEDVKRGLLENVPQDVEVVIFFTIPESADLIEEWARPHLNKGAVLHLLALDTYDSGFWARDGLPIPVYSDDQLVLIDAKYYHGFKTDREVASFIGVPLERHSYYFEGGNFVPDMKGNCFLVRHGTGSSMPEYILRDYYGCQKSVYLHFNSGIGHVDERLKIVSDSVAITDTKAYRSTLEEHGYEVKMLPRPKTPYGTYVNSLLVNGTLFLPTFGEDRDDEAIAIYEELGFKVVPLMTNTLSSQGLGSIHCITMTYPEQFGANLYLGLF